eukprot:m.211681 g.211681  ORF g.211681 m.211681 type:complete len:401 (-) comp25616_c0_seq1:56-1258(-)
MAPTIEFVAASSLLEDSKPSSRSKPHGDAGIRERESAHITSTPRTHTTSPTPTATATATTMPGATAAVLVPSAHADEMLVRILVWLTVPELTAARAVCTAWRQAADSNYIWRSICGRRWPSALTEPVRRMILARGGFRTYYLATSPRPPSTMADFVFTMDVTGTSYVGLPFTEALGGVSFTGADLQGASDATDDPQPRRFIVTMSKPWYFRVKPYAFKTLGDLVDRVRGGEGTPHGAVQSACLPELKLDVGVMHRSAMRQAQIATLSEGRDLRSSPWYRERGNARLAEDEGGAESPHPTRRKTTGGRRRQAATLDFSGCVALPTHLGGMDRQVLDVSLRGVVTEMDDATRLYEMTSLVFGPLFNLNDGPAAATSADITECLDLKLGLHTEDRSLSSYGLF